MNVDVEVTDSNRARLGLGLLGGAFLANAGVMLLNAAVMQLSGTLGLGGAEVFFNATQAFWVLSSAVEVWALYELAHGVKPAPLVWALLGTAAVFLLSSLFWLAVELLPHEERFRAPAALNVALTLAGLVEVLGFCFIVGKLGRTTAFAWGAGIFAVLRALTSLAFVLRAAGAERPPLWVHSVRIGLALVSMSILGALALHARGVVERGAVAPSGGPAPAPITEVSGMRQVFIGVALLVLGVGGSAVSYAVASSGSGGGHYFVATGLIAAGIVQVVRGATRLGR
ncbi:MAG: hypothetical protein JNK82_00340 [Myxococcaceae bacterium]|nr:hypothetical protein [Myxococcaceae bacterium]